MRFKYKKVAVIVNPVAGKERPIVQTLYKVFTPAGVEWELFISMKPGDAKDCAEHALLREFDVIAVYGGDGTVMDVAGALVGTSIPLLILRGGTGNLFASEMDVPFDIRDACQTLVSDQYRLRDVDVGQVNDQYFLLRCSVGFEADLVRNADRDLKNQVGSFAYAIAAFKALVGTRPATYHLEMDGQVMEVDALSCIVANSGVLGIPGLKLAPNISIDDGYLDVIVFRYPDMEALFSMASYVIDKRPASESFYHWKAQSIHLKTVPQEEVHCDGELLGQTKLSIKILPRALTVLVPDSKPVFPF